MRTSRVLLNSIALAILVLVVFPSAAFAADTTTTTSSSPTKSQAILAFVSFGTAVLVIVIGLVFSFQYHKHLMALMRFAIKKGLSVGSTDVPAVEGAATPATGGTVASQDSVAVQGLEDGIKVLVPEKLEVGKRAVFKVVHLPGNGNGEAVTWQIVRKDAVGPALTWTGREFEHSFSEAGACTLTVTAAEENVEPYSADLNVAEPAAPAKPSDEASTTPSAVARAGASLQALFSMRNWARFVIVIFGVGAVSALLFGKIITSEGGIGLLGALLGVGATSAPDPAPGTTPAPTAGQTPAPAQNPAPGQAPAPAPAPGQAPAAPGADQPPPAPAAS